MDGAATGALAAVTTVLVILLIAALFGRVHGQTGNAEVNPLGDRLASGLLALPLVAVWVKLAFPEAPVWALLMAPVPLAIYVGLLAGTGNEHTWAKERFNFKLLVGFGIFYLLAAVVLVLTGQGTVP